MLIIEKLYIVKFYRRDCLQTEEYTYYDKIDAENHFRIFINDDSGLYRKISLIQCLGNNDKELQVLNF